MKKYLIIGLIAVCLTFYIIPLASCQTNITNVIEDAELIWDGGAGYSRDQAGALWTGVFGANTYRTFIEFNISSLPQNRVKEIKFYYQGQGNTGDLNITEPSSRPSTTGDQAAYNSINSGVVFYDTAGYPSVGTQKVITLNSAAITSLETALNASQAWWAIGQIGIEGGGNTVSIISSSEGGNPVPTLSVTFFSPPNAPTINNPANLTVVYPTQTVTYNWTFSDPNPGDTQSAFRLQIDNDPAFGSPIVDTGKNSTSTSIYVNPAPIPEDLYYWRVKTWDNGSLEGSYNSPARIINVSAPVLILQSINASESRVGVNVLVGIDANITETDGTPFTLSPVTIEGFNATHQGGGIWRSNQTRTSPAIYNVSEVSTIFGNLSWSGVNVTWDLFNFTLSSTNTIIDIPGQPEFVYATGISVIDNTTAVGGLLSINGFPFTYEPLNNRFTASFTSPIPVNLGLNTVSNFIETTYNTTQAIIVNPLILSFVLPNSDITIQGVDQLIYLVMLPYNQLLGLDITGAFLLLGLFMPIYLSTRNVGYMAVLAFVVFGTVAVAFPAQGVNFAMMTLGIAAGYLIYGAYTSVRR